MRVEIRSHLVSIDTESRGQIAQRIESALEPFRHAVREVTAFLTDINGPRGGSDKRCRLVVSLPPGGRVVVSHTDRDLLAAAERAAARCRFAIRRYLKRRWARRVRAGQADAAISGRIVAAFARMRGRR